MDKKEIATNIIKSIDFEELEWLYESYYEIKYHKNTQSYNQISSLLVKYGCHYSLLHTNFMKKLIYNEYKKRSDFIYLKKIHPSLTENLFASA